MESSRRAVESYWRSRTIDAATSDEDKVTPVYKLEEICDMLRSSHVSVVKEVSEFVLKRLDHKSPVVKQKALRLIKYCVPKSGAEFRREIQRNSAAVRNLIHYKGQPDVLKGDALNKAVRATATEAISTIFSEEAKRETPNESRNRIQGFGNTSMENPTEERKSFISEVVGMGSASIIHGINNIAQAHSLMKSESANSYKTPNLQRSFFTDSEPTDNYEPARLPNQTLNQRRGLDTDYGFNNLETTNIDSHKEVKTPAEKLLETIATPGGVRLQPTRDAIQVFLSEAAKLMPLPLIDAIDSKLQSPSWQVRLKTLCVVESMILRKKEEDTFLMVFIYFDERRKLIKSCSESPQSSLREKANRVLKLLGEKQETIGSSSIPVSEPVPDLLDTGYDNEDSKEEKSKNTDSFENDLLGERFDANDDDPFNDVKFHTDDLLGGIPVEDGLVTASNKHELADLLGASEPKEEKTDISDLMNGLTVNGDSVKMAPESLFSDIGFANVGSTTLVGDQMKPGLETAQGPNPDLQNSHVVNPGLQDMFGVNSGLHGTYGMNQGLQGIYGSSQGLQGTYGFNQGLQGTFGLNQGLQVPYGLNQGFQGGPYVLNQGMMGGFVLNPGFQSQPLGFMGHQPVTAMNANGSYGLNPSGALPDIFQVGNSVMNSNIPTSRKEETRAFDFISEHVAATRDQKKVA